MTAPMTTTNCPIDPNLLAAFIDGRLDGDERRTVTEHMAGCAECRDVMMMAGEMPEEITADVTEPTNVVPIRRRSWVPAVAMAAIAAALAVVFLGPITDRIMQPRRLRALSAATARLDERPIATRPSMDMPYNDFRVMRGTEEDDESALIEPALPLLTAREKRPTVENLHAAGLALLLMKQGRAAVAALEHALTSKEEPSETEVAAALGASTDAHLLNDLAAAYYQTNNKMAKTAIDRAWQLKQSPPIAWTRATILSTDAAWNDYLAIDSTSEWAAEARKNLTTYTGN